jgi:hypothetical protein
VVKRAVRRFGGALAGVGSLALWVASAASGAAGAAGATAALDATGEADAPEPSPPLCQATLRLEPEHAFVGQQVLYEARILRRRDVSALSWDRPPSFPAFRAEWLPGISGDVPVELAGESYLAFFERRALFPARDGVLEVPPAALRCETAEGQESVRIPGARLTVEALPAAGRPPDFAGLVGPVEVGVTANAATIELGASVRISVALRGATNLWDAAPPLPAPGAVDAWDDVEVFPYPPEIARDAGRRLRLRRYFVYDLVPRREGELRVPPLQLAWFDPVEQRYRATESEPLTVAVVPPRPARPNPAAPSAASPSRRGAQRGAGIRQLAWLAAGVLGAALLVAGLVLRGRRGARPGAPRGLEERLAEAEALGAAGDDASAAAAMAHAIRAALTPRLPDAGALASEEIAARAGGDAALREAALLLGRIDRARFEPGAAPPDLAAVRACIDGLRDR